MDLTTPAELERHMIQRNRPMTDLAVYRRALEDHLHLFHASSYAYIDRDIIEPGIAVMYEGDFIGLMRFLGKNTNHDWINMRINNLTSPVQFGPDTLEIYSIKGSLFDQIINQVRTQLQDRKVKK